LGCLISLLIVAAIGYFGINVGEAYFRFYQYQDAMRQEARFAGTNSDAVILRRLRQQADSLGLPEAAGVVTLQRDGRHIEMESDYTEHIELPLVARDIHFNPHAEGTF
jgi:hypothetical protein